MIMQHKSIFIIAGEASGDLLGANLATALRHLDPKLQIIGMGGKKMHEAGVDIIVDNKNLDIIGWLGVIKNIFALRKIIHKLKSLFYETKPDLLILIDYPGFNLHLAKIAKKAGIKILYYVSPKIWAWRYGRIKKIKRYVDHMAVLFAFEVKIYQQEEIPVTFVGHPLSALIKFTQLKESVYHQYALNPNHKVIALLPGSRRGEIEYILPTMLQAAKLIKQAQPETQFVLPLASSLQLTDIQKHLTMDVTIIENNTYNILSICAAAIVTSGTATLEVALCQVPLVVVYKGNFINYLIARCVIRIDHIGLCNIIAGETVAKELIQHKATPDSISAEILQLISNDIYRQKRLNQLKKVREILGFKHNSEEVARLAMKIVG